MTDLLAGAAVDLVDALRAGDTSASELMAATLDRIEQLNPQINAIVSIRDRDVLMAEAAARDDLAARGEPLGALHGMPWAVKDLASVAGIRTSSGSRVTPEGPAPADSLFVERLRAEGVIFIGKTNTPEFGTGSHTINDVFGLTRNPHDLERSAGGSSGGAAAALATRMLAIADGSDLGGSLRNPAAFCNVVGFRPSIGRVPRLDPTMAFSPRLATEGPMARSVADLAMLLSVMAGPDHRDPLARSDPGEDFREIRSAQLSNIRIAWAGDLLGFPVQTSVSEVVAAAVSRLAEAGAKVEPAWPDLSDALEVFRTMRWVMYRDLAAAMIPDDSHHLLRPNVKFSVDAGAALTLEDVERAQRGRTRLHREVVEFFARYDVLALPTTQVAPFPCELDHPTEINGQAMDDYLEWMSSCCVITPTGCPAISMPAGFTDEGLPVGLQLVAAPGGDKQLLEVAAAFEVLTAHAKVQPSVLG